MRTHCALRASGVLACEGSSNPCPAAAPRDLLQRLNRRHAYVRCAETLKLRSLLSSALSQLHGHRRKKSEGWASLEADSLCRFMQDLPSEGAG